MAAPPPEPPPEPHDDAAPERPPIVLTEADLLGPVPAPASTPLPAPRRREPAPPVSSDPYAIGLIRPPGPGLGGSLLWVLGVALVQIVGGAIATAVFAPEMFTAAAHGQKLEMADLSADAVQRVVGSTQAAFLAASVLAAWLYFGRRLPRRMPLRAPAGRHVAVVVALVLPLALLGGFLAEQVLALLERFGPSGTKSLIPAMELLAKIAESRSFAALLFTFAITPAIAEEIVFRGVIGRGLVARYGLLGGVLITSVLFAAVHGSLAHAAGVIPIGIAMHVAYLATRSFWVPVLMHFLNNSLPVLMMFSLEGAGAEAVTQEAAPVGLPGALAALACVVTLTSLLWQSRVEYLAPDGRPLEPAFPTVEPPPPDRPHTMTFRRPSIWLVVGAVLSLVAFFAALASAAPETL